MRAKRIIPTVLFLLATGSALPTLRVAAQVRERSAVQQCSEVTRAQAQAALARLRVGETWAIELCEPCGERLEAQSPYRVTSARMVASIGPAARGRFSVHVNGHAVDLAYVYVRTDGSTYQSLATLARCPAQDISPRVFVEGAEGGGADRRSPDSVQGDSASLADVLGGGTARERGAQPGAPSQPPTHASGSTESLGATRARSTPSTSSDDVMRQVQGVGVAVDSLGARRSTRDDEEAARRAAIALERAQAEFTPIIQRMIRSRMTAIRRCYERELQNNPRLAGRLVIRITVMPAGTVQNVATTENLLSNTAVAHCVETVFRGFRFAPGPDVQVSFSFPFDFAPQR